MSTGLAAADYDAKVEAIMRAASVDRVRATEIARANGIVRAQLTDAELAQQRRDARILEDAEQRAVIKVFREHGFTVRSTSQHRPSKVSIGILDLFCTHTSQPIAFWFDAKRQVGGVISDAQRDFMADCWRCGMKAYAGDRYEAERICRDHGLSRIP